MYLTKDLEGLAVYDGSEALLGNVDEVVFNLDSGRAFIVVKGEAVKKIRGHLREIITFDEVYDIKDGRVYLKSSFRDLKKLLMRTSEYSILIDTLVSNIIGFNVYDYNDKLVGKIVSSGIEKTQGKLVLIVTGSRIKSIRDRDYEIIPISEVKDIGEQVTLAAPFNAIKELILKEHPHGLDEVNAPKRTVKARSDDKGDDISPELFDTDDVVLMAGDIERVNNQVILVLEKWTKEKKAIYLSYNKMPKHTKQVLSKAGADMDNIIFVNCSNVESDNDININPHDLTQMSITINNKITDPGSTLLVVDAISAFTTYHTENRIIAFVAWMNDRSRKRGYKTLWVTMNDSSLKTLNRKIAEICDETTTV